ncbi:hypothetical protein [Amycolatopsis sp. NPDC003731]
MTSMKIRRLTPSDLEPELLAIALPIYRRWEAAVLRVAANHTASARFALPIAENTPESILAPRFQELAKTHPATADLVASAAAEKLTLPRTRRRLESVLELKFDSSRSVDDLAAIPVTANPTSADIIRLLDRHYAQIGLQRTTSGAVAPQDRVALDLVRVVCVDETNGFLGSEAGDDEIYLSGATIDDRGATDKIDPFKIGNFSDGDRKDFNPAKRLHTWQVATSNSYPKHFFASLFLFEKDQGDLDATFEKLFRKFADEVATKLASILGTTVGALLGGPLGAAAGALIGWLTGWLMGKLVDALVSAWKDDPFNPVQLEFIIPNWTSSLVDPSKVFHFTGPGEYAVRYRWSASTPQLQRA